MQKAGYDNELQSLKLVKQKAVIWQEKVNTQTWNNKNQNETQKIIIQSC